MSEFFLELFSEEIPPKLQTNARKKLFFDLNNFFEENNIKIKGSTSSHSTTNRIIISFSNISKEVIRKSLEIRGPSVSAKREALEGFLKSHNINKSQAHLRTTEKGEFYFFKKPSQKLFTIHLLEENIPTILDTLQWKKSMKWGNYNLNWARPLKSILAVFDNKNLNFNFYHLKASNTSFIDKEFEDKKRIFKNFKSYNNFFYKFGIIIDHISRKKFIKKELDRISKKKNFIVELNDKLLDEVTNIVDKPNILICKFDEKFLSILKEILNINMQNHQK